MRRASIQILVDTVNAPSAAAAVTTAQMITTRGECRFNTRLESWLPKRGGQRQDRKQDSGDHRDVVRRIPELAKVQRQHRAKAAIDELEPEKHEHHQEKVLEREDRCEAASAAARRRPVEAAAAP